MRDAGATKVIMRLPAPERNDYEFGARRTTVYDDFERYSLAQGL